LKASITALYTYLLGPAILLVQDLFLILHRIVSGRLFVLMLFDQ
jgi:hypothetical protein